MTDVNKNKLAKKIQISFKILENNLGDKIDYEALSPLANMLSLNYYDVHENKLPKTINECSVRISNYIGHRVIIGYDFGVVLTLFSVAISEEDIKPELLDDVTKILSKEEIISHLLESGEEIEITPDFLDFLDHLLQKKDNKELLTYISQNKRKTSDILCKLIDSNKFENKTQLYIQACSVLSELSFKKNTYQEIKNGINMFASTAISGSIAVACVMGLSIIAPLVIVPATAIGVKIVSSQIDKITSVAVDKFSSYRDDTDKVVDKAINDYLFKKSHTQEKEPSKQISNELAKQAAQLFTKEKLEEFKEKEYGEEVKEKVERLKKNVSRDRA